MNLSNKICLVTGGSRGIGRSISLELAKAGAIVIINFLHNEKAASELVSKIEGFGETAICINLMFHLMIKCQNGR